MRVLAFTLPVTALAAAATLAAAGPAAAQEPPGPDTHASCVGQTFVPQAVGTPGAIAARIAEIKGFIPAEWSFGTVIGDFARWPDCSPE